MRIYIISIIVCVGAFLSCNQTNTSVSEIKDKDLLLQVSEIKENAPEDESLNYKIRISPSKELLENETIEQKRALSYKMDSCFYINNSSGKNYASMVQAVANGVAGTYEYLVVFNLDKNSKRDSINMVYQDRYINKKMYGIKLIK